jgi:hypothetical protein
MVKNPADAGVWLPLKTGDFSDYPRKAGFEDKKGSGKSLFRKERGKSRCKRQKCLDASAKAGAYARKGRGGASPRRKSREFELPNDGHRTGGENRMLFAVCCLGANDHRVVK